MVGFIVYHGRPSAPKCKCSEMLDILKCKMTTSSCMIGKEPCDNKLGDGWNFISYDLWQDDSGLKASTTICSFLQFLSISLIIERILVYSEATL